MRMGSPLHSEPTDLWLLSLPHFIMLSDTGQRKWPRPVPCYQILHISIRMSLFPRRHCGFLEFGLDVPHVVVELLIHVWLSVTLWTVAHQGPLSLIIPWSLLKLISIEPMMLSNHLILSPSSLAFNLSQHQVLFQWVDSAPGGQSIGASASATVLPTNIQDWFPLGLTGLILLSKGLSRVLQHQNLGTSILWCSAFFIVTIIDRYEILSSITLWSSLIHGVVVQGTNLFIWEPYCILAWASL